MQAKDVADSDFLGVVSRLSMDFRYGTEFRCVMHYEVEEAFPGAPWKVLLAKAKALHRRGLLDGCFCGCRGDYELIDMRQP